MTRYIALLSLLFLARLVLAQNVAPRLQDIGVTPGRDLQFTLQNGLFDTTQAVSAKLTYSAGGRLLPVQPTAGRSGRDIQVYLSGANTQKLPAVSYLQILIGGQPAYVGNVVTSYAGRPGTIGSPVVVNYVVSGGGGIGAGEIATAIAPLSLSVTNLATGLAAKLTTTTYTANRTVDQAATTAAQNTANTALTVAGSATAVAAQLTSQVGSLSSTVGTKVDKNTTVTVNGVTQALTGPISFSVDVPVSPSLTAVSQLSNDANYQTGSQVGAALSSAVNSVTAAQQVTDNNQTLSLSQKASITSLNSFTTAQAAIDAGQSSSIAQAASDVAGKLSTGTYTSNRAADQAATTTAQNTANTALTTANSATAALGNKVDKATTISINGMSQSLSGPVSFTLGGTGSTTLTQVSQLSNDAGYQNGSQVATAISSATTTLSNSQTAIDASQNTDIANRLLTGTYNTNRTSDQAATAAAQSTANTALSTANSATATGASNGTAITTLQNAGYQTASQVASAVNSATTTVANNQTAVDAAQNTQIAARQPTVTTSTTLTPGEIAVTNNATVNEIRLRGSTDAQTAEYALRAFPGLGVRIAGNWIIRASGQMYTQGTGEIRTDNTLTFTTQGRTSIWNSTGVHLGSGNLPTSALQITGTAGTNLRITNPYTPTSATDATGATGNIEWGTSGLFVKTADGWKYSPLYLVGTNPPTGGSGAVSSVNGRTGDVTGLAEASSLNNYQPLITESTSFSAGQVGGGLGVFGGPTNSTSPALVVNAKTAAQNLYSFRDQNGIERMAQSQNGNMLINGNLRILNGSDGSHFRIQNPYTPTSTTDANGLAGNIEWNDNAVAVKTSTGWKYAPLTPVGSQPASNTAVNYVLASTSPYLPVTTVGNSSTITDALSTALGVPVFARDQASIQALINSLPSSTTAIPRLLFFGKYDFSANANTPLTVSKNLELVGINGASFDGGTVNGFLMLANSISTRLLVENITFRSNSTTSAYALTYFNEQGDCRNVTFRRCRWHAPKGNYNAIGLNTWNGTSGSFMENVLFDECVVDSVGRMGGEGLAQKNDGVIRIKNLTWNNCRFDNVGLYNPANVTKASAQINGMALSISGDIQGVQINNFVARNALVGIELVSAKDVNIVNPTITGARSSTYSDAGILPATGISITDGGSTDRGVTGRSATNITITGGSVNMAGKGIGTYYADRLTVTGTKFTAGAYMEIQHATRLNLSSFDYEMTGRNFIASFEDVKNSQIRNVRFSRENNTVTPIYQPINIDGNTANTVFSDISIVTNTAYNGGNPDNYYNDQQPFRLRYINEAGTNNSIKDIFLNGQKMPDQVYEAIPTLAITAAGSVTALTHISRININPTTTISSLTLVLPTTSQDRKDVEVNFGGTLSSGTVVTTLTIQGPGGNAPVQSNTPTSASAGQVFTYRYDSTIARYRRIN